MVELAQRRWIGRLVQFALIGITLAVIAAWFMRRSPSRSLDLSGTEQVESEALAPGDVRIFNVDSSVDLMLRGDRMSAGLSPKTINKVRSELERSSTKDTSGFGGAIAQMVKKQVADKIDTRVVYSVNDIRDIRYEDERILVEWRDGREEALFGGVKVDGDRSTNRFRRDDAERFIAAVKARQRR
jgi:hypothetical protein